MTKQKTKRITETVAWEGRDELNLAEFPIASLSSRPDKARKTLQFEDRIWDKGLGRHVTRKLMITASDRYALLPPDVLPMRRRVVKPFGVIVEADGVPSYRQRA